MSKMYPRTSSGGYTIKLLSQISPVIFYTENEPSLKKAKSIYNFSFIIVFLFIIFNYTMGMRVESYNSKLFLLVFGAVYFFAIHIILFFSSNEIVLYDENKHGTILEN